MRARMEGKRLGLVIRETLGKKGSGDKTKKKNKTGQIGCERARQTEMDEGDRV